MTGLGSPWHLIFLIYSCQTQLGPQKQIKLIVVSDTTTWLESKMRWIIQSSLYLPPASSRWRVSSCEAWSPSARSRSSCCRRCSSPRCPSCCGTPCPPAGPGPPRPDQGKHEFWAVTDQWEVRVQVTWPVSTNQRPILRTLVTVGQLVIPAE